MKQQIPVPVIVAAVVVLLAVGGYFLINAGSGEAEFKAPAVSKVIPRYVWDTLPKSEQDRMRAEGYSVGDVKPTGQPGKAPGTK